MARLKAEGWREDCVSVSRLRASETAAGDRLQVAQTLVLHSMLASCKGVEWMQETWILPGKEAETHGRTNTASAVCTEMAAGWAATRVTLIIIIGSQLLEEVQLKSYVIR